MTEWTQHHVVAQCLDCTWSLAEHGTDKKRGQRVIEHGRGHARDTGHHVQAERGQHKSLDAASEARP